MARTTWPKLPTPLAARVLRQAIENGEEQKEQAAQRRIARRHAKGREFCPNRLRGPDWEDPACEVCPDNLACALATDRRLVSVEDNLLKVFEGGQSEEWRIDGTFEIDRAEKRVWIVDYVQHRMQEAEHDPELIEKFQALRDSTNRCLDALVPGYKEFRQEVAKQKPRMAPDPEKVLAKLHEIGFEVAETAENVTGMAWVEKLISKLAVYLDKLRNTYPKEFDKNQDRWPRKWMQNNKKIREMMSKRRHFVPLLNHLTRQTLSLKASQELAAQIGAGEYQKGRPYLMLRKVEPEKIGHKLGVSGATVKKYLLEFCRIGVLRNFCKTGPNGFSEYAIGYWSFRKDGQTGRYTPARRWFLTDTPEMRKALVDFDPYSSSE